MASLDDHDDTVSLMVSENILVRDGPRVAFFHEGFFDYIFARGFVASGRDLVPYITEQEQSLFIRSQVRQVLLHLRDVSKQDFVRTLEVILSSPDIRTHVKTIVLSLLGTIDDPTEDEWNTVAPLLDSDLSGHVIAAMYNSLPWFDLLDRIGVIQRWLEIPDDPAVSRSRVLSLLQPLQRDPSSRLVKLLSSLFYLLDRIGIMQRWLEIPDDPAVNRNRALSLLRPLQRARSTRLAELLSQFLGASDSWDERLASIFLSSECGASEEFFAFSLELVKRGALDQLLDPTNQTDHVWLPLDHLVESSPDWACRLIEAYLRRLFAIAKESGASSPFPSKLRSSTTGKDAIMKAAAASPQEFAKLLLPFLTTVLENNVDKRLGLPWGDSIWGYSISDSISGLDDSLLSGMEEALRLLALNEPDEFQIYETNLRESECLIHQYLLMRSYAADGQRYADEAVEYVVEDFRVRLATDYAFTSSEIPIRQLLREVTPHCSPDKLRRLEQLILGHYPEWEKGKEGRRRRGASQMRLLESIDTSRISEEAARRLQEHHRKFGDAHLAEPIDLQGSYVVRPPIPDSAASRMSDNDWLRAIERHSSNSPSRENFLVGGAVEQSRVLEEQAKQDPYRFAKFILRIPDDANPVYFDAILQGVAKADIDMDTIVAACLRCHRIPGRPSGRWITQPLAHAKDFPLSDEALELVAWYATKDPEPDPKQVSSMTTYYQGGRKYDRYEPLSVGINSARGAAAGSVARLIFRDERYFAFFRPYLKTMVNDPSDAVLSCVGETLLGALKHDRNLAVELFLEMCAAFDREDPQFALDERLLATHYVEVFLKYAVQTHFDELEPTLRRMIESDFEEVAEAGARWVCFASLTAKEALPLAKRCASGTESMRLGAASVYQANIATSAFRSECEDMLSKLFSDPDAEIRREAARCFYQFEGPTLEESETLVEDFIRSPAFESGHNPLFDALEKTTANMPDVVLMACERIFDLAGEETGDISTATSGTSGAVATLIARVYSRNTNPIIRARCLDVIDRMALHRAYGLDSITAEFDRQQ